MDEGKRYGTDDESNSRSPETAQRIEEKSPEKDLLVKRNRDPDYENRPRELHEIFALQKETHELLIESPSRDPLVNPLVSHRDKLHGNDKPCDEGETFEKGLRPRRDR